LGGQNLSIGSLGASGERVVVWKAKIYLTYIYISHNHLNFHHIYNYLFILQKILI
jgi:hypothetical protein